MENGKPTYEELENKILELERFIENDNAAGHYRDIKYQLASEVVEQENIAHLVDGKYGIKDLLDIERLKYIFEKFTQSTGFTIGFLDHPELNLLITVGWRDICTKFHRNCKATADICTKSNKHLTDALNEPYQIVVEPCENGLVDCATPIIIKGKHIATLATGQLLLEAPDVESFRKQAKMYNFDEQAYLNALSEIPVVSQETLRNVTLFLGEIASIISDMGYANLIIKEESKKLEIEIAERKRAELRLEDQNRKLHSMNSELEQFAFITSHDLQEPLRTLTCFAELIQKEYDDKLDDDGKKYLEFILNSSERMKQLIKDLLDYSRIGKAKEIVKINFNEIVNEVIIDMDVLIKENNAKITVDDLPVIDGYKIELRQLFQNLISNSIKFRKKDVSPEISISVHKQDKMWRFEVKDNGIGIDENDKEKIFIIFRRLHNRSVYEGTGIGLSFCKKIIELHNGSIWVESKVDEGSAFCFTIPI